MRIGRNAFFVILFVGLAFACGTAVATAQGVMRTAGTLTIALKSGESLEISDLYFVKGCRSVLKGTPEVEILEGPPGVTASIKEAMVLPRWQNCSERVSGGKLILSAKEIEDPSFSRLTLRITYKTKDGDRKHGEVINLQLVP